MGLFEHWPYVNFHDLNLDWIIGKIKNIEDAEAHTEELAEAADASADRSEHQAANAAASALDAAQSANDSEESALSIRNVSNQVLLNTQRIDNILVQGTPTEGNAELIDIRVAADGTVYNTAGDSVRGQINELDGMIIKRQITDDWLQGWYGVGSGAKDDSKLTYIRKVNFLDDSIYKIVCPSGYGACIQAWNENGDYVGMYKQGEYVTSGDHFMMQSVNIAELKNDNPNYRFRLSIHSTNGNIDPSYSTIPAIYESLINQNQHNIETIFNDAEGLFEQSSLATWHVGSITQDGAEYPSNTAAVSTPRNNAFFLKKGVHVVSENPLIKTVFIFRYLYNLSNYQGRTGVQGNTDVVTPEDGYYRIVLINASGDEITEETITNYTDGFKIYNKTLTEYNNNFKVIDQRLNDLEEGVSYPYAYDGMKINTALNKFNLESVGYSLPAPSDISSGLTSRQDFDAYNGVLFQLYSDNYIALIDLTTGSLLNSYQINSGHGNACQFSNEFYDPADEYPLLYCFAYTTNLVYVNRVTNTGATLIRTYQLNTDGYRFSGGLDVINNRIISINYYRDNSHSANNNHMIVAEWDLNNTTESGGVLIPSKIQEHSIPFIPTIQGCTFFKDVLYIVAGYYPTYSIPVKLYGIKRNGDVVTVIEDFPESVAHSEGEGVFFYKTENKYQCYMATYNMYKMLL